MAQLRDGIKRLNAELCPWPRSLRRKPGRDSGFPLDECRTEEEEEWLAVDKVMHPASSRARLRKVHGSGSHECSWQGVLKPAKDKGEDKPEGKEEDNDADNQGALVVADETNAGDADMLNSSDDEADEDINWQSADPEWEWTKSSQFRAGRL